MIIYGASCMIVELHKSNYGVPYIKIMELHMWIFELQNSITVLHESIMELHVPFI